jgi:hypothetical protein
MDLKGAKVKQKTNMNINFLLWVAWGRATIGQGGVCTEAQLYSGICPFQYTAAVWANSTENAYFTPFCARKRKGSPIISSR